MLGNELTYNQILGRLKCRSDAALWKKYTKACQMYYTYHKMRTDLNSYFNFMSIDMQMDRQSDFILTLPPPIHCGGGGAKLRDHDKDIFT